MSKQLNRGLLISCVIVLASFAGLLLAGRSGVEIGTAASGVDGPDAGTIDETERLNTIMHAAGEAARRAEYESAVEGFLSIPAGGDPRAVAAQLQAGQILLMELRQPTRGFAVLNELLGHFPEQSDARTLLAQYFDAVGRQFESDEQSREVVRIGDTRQLHLLRLGQYRTGVGDPELLGRMRQSSPDDLNVQLGTALLEISAGNHASAEQALRNVVAQSPELWSAQAALGTTLINQGKSQQFDSWRASLPSGSEASSEVWLVRGLAAERREQPEVAARCFVEAVRIDPDNWDANRQAMRWLEAIGRTADAAFFATRAAQLAELAELVRDQSEVTDAARLDRAATLTEQMGRPWEARAWTYNLAKTDRQNPDHQARLMRFRQFLVPEYVENLRHDANPANQVDVSDLPDM